MQFASVRAKRIFASKSHLVEASAYLPLLYVSSLFDALKAAQAQYLAAHADYYELRKKQVVKANASTLKDQLLQMLNGEIVLHLNAMVQMVPEVYEEFAQAVGSLIGAMNVQIKRRGTIASRAKEVETV